MNIKLLLENQEVELNKNINFPLNKTYENIANPTQIIVEYSKSIDIPMTSHNNRILGNAYRLDKTIVSNNQNIGLYLDPSKKIPFKLLFLDDVVLEGYAKYQSACYSSDSNIYKLNLFGKLGEIFQKLNDIVIDEKNLPEGLSRDYILNDHLSGAILDKEYIKKSWLKNTYGGDIQTAKDEDIIGFAPAYRGLPEGFDGKKIQYQFDKIGDITDNVRSKWIVKYKSTHPQNTGETDEDYEKRVEDAVDKLKPSDLVGDGIMDYQFNQYRSVDMKPYIYMDKLFQMYREKCKKITGYDMILDSVWFNDNNPYYSKLCYMFDYLDFKKLKSKEDVNLGSNFYSTMKPSSLPGARLGRSLIDSNTAIDQFPANTDGIGIKEMKLHIRSVYKNDDIHTIDLESNDGLMILIQINMRSAGKTTLLKRYWAGKTFDNTGLDPNYYNADNFINYNILKTQGTPGVDSTHSININIPEFIAHIEPFTNDPTNFKIEVITSLFINNNNPRKDNPYYLKNGPDIMYLDLNSQFLDVRSQIDDILAVKSIRNKINVKLKNLYIEESSLFNLLIKYTKMFDLKWVVDYKNHKLFITTRDKYFSQGKFINWDNKINRSKECVIQPITFPTQYVEFNYEDVDGYNYNEYQNKYNISYGSKKIKTNYDFNTESSKLFEGIQPSCSSNRNFLTYWNILNWDLNSSLVESSDEYERIDTDKDDKKSAIELNNFYFRCNNYIEDVNKFILTDDTSYMNLINTPCWISVEYGDHAHLLDRINNFPHFSTVVKQGFIQGNKYYGCLFNKPNLDFTTDKNIEKADFIYDLFWKDYINERYNIQNKKLTAYFNLNVDDYSKMELNNFITLNNQLFVINKIFDYDLTSKEPTKVELIQVSDITKYTSSATNFNNIIMPDKMTLEAPTYTKELIAFIPKYLTVTQDNIYTDNPNLSANISNILEGPNNTLKYYIEVKYDAVNKENCNVIIDAADENSYGGHMINKTSVQII